MKTYMAKTGELKAKWYLVDVSDMNIGRAAVKIASILMGKHRPVYTPHIDTGEFVVVINASKLKLSGNKLEQKAHERFTGYPGGRRVVPLDKVLAQHPERIVYEAVERMLPRNTIGLSMITKLKIYPGAEHPHQAQQPEPLKL